MRSHKHGSWKFYHPRIYYMKLNPERCKIVSQ